MGVFHDSYFAKISIDCDVQMLGSPIVDLFKQSDQYRQKSRYWSEVQIRLEEVII